MNGKIQSLEKVKRLIGQRLYSPYLFTLEQGCTTLISGWPKNICFFWNNTLSRVEINKTSEVKFIRFL
jgi:hypothetical protein